jgi:hypothetical protein
MKRWKVFKKWFKEEEEQPSLILEKRIEKLMDIYLQVKDVGNLETIYPINNTESYLTSIEFNKPLHTIPNLPKSEYITEYR